MKIFESSFSPYDDTNSWVTPHTTIGNVQCLKLLLGVYNTLCFCFMRTVGTSVELVREFVFLSV
jgi:hypothetical protein